MLMAHVRGDSGLREMRAPRPLSLEGRPCGAQPLALRAEGIGRGGVVDGRARSPAHDISAHAFGRPVGRAAPIAVVNAYGTTVDGVGIDARPLRAARHVRLVGTTAGGPGDSAAQRCATEAHIATRPRAERTVRAQSGLRLGGARGRGEWLGVTHALLALAVVDGLAGADVRAAIATHVAGIIGKRAAPGTEGAVLTDAGLQLCVA